MLAKRQLEVVGTQNLVAPTSGPLRTMKEDPFVYHIQCAPGYLIEAEMFLHIQGQVKKVTGTRVELPHMLDKVSFCHLAPLAMIKDVTVFLNNTKITTNQNGHPYLALLQSLTNYAEEERKFIFSRSCYYPDEAYEHNNYEDPAPDQPASAFMKRRVEMASDTFDFYVPLLTDMIQTYPYPDNVNIDISVTRNSPNFYINGDVPDGTEYKVDIMKADLCYRRLQLQDPLFKTMGKKDFSYPAKRYEVKTVTIGQESANITCELDKMDAPEKLHVFTVSQDAFNGAYAANPFYLQHNFIKSVYLEINNNIRIPLNEYEFGIRKPSERKLHRVKRAEPAVPEPAETKKAKKEEQPAETKKTKKEEVTEETHDICNYSRAYMESMMAMKDTPTSPNCCPINYEEFGAGWFLLTFDPRKDRNPSEQQKYLKQDVGTIRLISQLHRTLPKPIVLIAICVYNSVITIKESGEVVREM